MSGNAEYLDGKPVAPRTSQENETLRRAGYNPANHPAWMSLAYLLQIKADAHAEHERHLDDYRVKANAKSNA